MYEYHLLAYFYGWTDNYSSKLPISRRKKFIEQIKEQVKAENGEKDEADVE